MRVPCVVLLAASLIRASAFAEDGKTFWLEGVDLSLAAYESMPPRAASNTSGKPLVLDGVAYAHGIGTLAVTELIVDLQGQAERFESVIGLADGGPFGSVTFEVIADGKIAFSSGLVKRGDPSRTISVDLYGVKRMTLVTGNGGDGSRGDFACWGGAVLFLREDARAAPQAFRWPTEPEPPMASGVAREPQIHGPTVTGATPGRPFLFRIPATGDGPLIFAARHLPRGIALDRATGILSGAIERPGRTRTRVSVGGSRGRAERELIIVGESGSVALTPPLGWNSWNVWGKSIDAQKIRSAADEMVRTGLAAHGFQYVNIDDGWEGERDANGELQTNAQFGDMKALADYVHSKGLKLGIYSSPGPLTCAGFVGSKDHEEQDARTFARWGVDYLKYDWCSYTDRPRMLQLGRSELEAPYRLMHEALERTGRDVVFSLCQYGFGRVWEWGASLGGNLWRTTNDIRDTWFSLSSIGFSQDVPAPHAAPNHWNDPDMLVVGELGWGRELRATRLTRNEQITHLTLWSLLAAPLLLGCDLSRLDPWTLGLLTNDEVLAVDQDPLGRSARRISQDETVEVWARPLADGAWAVGLFNRGWEGRPVTARWADIGISGAQRVRDLWQRRDLGVFDGSFTTAVAQHGAVLVKVRRLEPVTGRTSRP